MGFLVYQVQWISNPVQSQILDTYQRNTFCGFVFFDESGSQLTGSVRKIIDVLDGTTAQSITYDEFGNQLSNTNPDFQPFGYAGGLTDYHTDLIRFGARDYDPSVGRWTSKEPLGFGGALNWYVYVSNDPVNWVDPSGLVKNKICSLHFGPEEFPASADVPFIGSVNVDVVVERNTRMDVFLETKPPELPTLRIEFDPPLYVDVPLLPDPDIRAVEFDLDNVKFWEDGSIDLGPIDIKIEWLKWPFTLENR
jgi:RHS repeat-associated protein